MMADINDDFVGELTTYLGNCARQKCDYLKPLLSYLTAHGYLSAFKMFFLNRDKEMDVPKCFEKDRWRNFFRAIYKTKADQARKSGEVSTVDVVLLMVCVSYRNYIHALVVVL